jgi:hypothetical protein
MSNLSTMQVRYEINVQPDRESEGYMLEIFWSQEH